MAESKTKKGSKQKRKKKVYQIKKKTQLYSQYVTYKKERKQSTYSSMCASVSVRSGQKKKRKPSKKKLEQKSKK